MKVCGCCYDPEIIGTLVDAGKWPANAYIIVPDDTPNQQGIVSHEVLEKAGFKWKELKEGMGIWYTADGVPCSFPCGPFRI